MNELYTQIVIVLLLTSVLIVICIKAFRNSHFGRKRLLLGMVLPAVFIGGCGTFIAGMKEIHPYLIDYCPPDDFEDVIDQAKGFVIPTTIYVAVYFAVMCLSKRKAEKTDPTRCKSCGYPLHGLPKPRCPECGEKFER